MNRNQTHSTRGPLARISHRFAAIIAELNFAGTQLSSARNTPEHF